MDSDNALIKRLQDRICDPRRFVDLPDVINPTHELYPPVSTAELETAEQKLAFRLPPLLRELYLQVGNGGFGPGYGLLALNHNGAKNYHMNLVDWYMEMVNNAPAGYEPWSRQLVIICNWGDGISSALNWTLLDAPVFRCRGDKYEGGP